jgi:large subunit ribosomal protein L18e
MRGTTNYQLQALISSIEPVARESGFWKAIVKNLKKPSRQRCSVNVYKIAQFAKDDEIVVIPGKVLSVGDLNKKINVAALQFSAGARDKIIGASGSVMTISELLKQNPEGKKVRILK